MEGGKLFSPANMSNQFIMIQVDPRVHCNKGLAQTTNIYAYKIQVDTRVHCNKGLG